MWQDPQTWVAISTILFLVLVAKPIGRGVGSALNARGKRIADELAEATKLKEEAQALLASYQRKQKEILAASEEMLNNARKEAAHISEQAIAKLDEELERRTDNAAKKIATLESQAVRQIQERAVEVTLEATRLLITEQLGSEAADEMLVSAIKDVERKFH